MTNYIELSNGQRVLLYLSKRTSEGKEITFPLNQIGKGEVGTFAVRNFIACRDRDGISMMMSLKSFKNIIRILFFFLISFNYRSLY